MSDAGAKRVVLRARPDGIAGPEHFAVEPCDVPDPGPGQFVVRARYWSVDPAMRGWVLDVPSYSPPVPLGGVMRAHAVGEVIASRHEGYPEGTCVSGLFGWQTHALSDGSDVDDMFTHKDLPLSYALGPLGMTGLTAWVGVHRILKAQAGETVTVSTAAGSVGSVAGQIAAALGCRTVGIAGGPEKAARCTEVFGYDAALDYRADDFAEALAAALPDGTDCYFDNTCGPVSDLVTTRLRPRARVAICGTAAITDWSGPPQGPRPHRHLLVARARMEGFLVFDHGDARQEAHAEIAGLIRAGQLNVREHVLDGPETAPGALRMLYAGQNTGKLLIRVS